MGKRANCNDKSREKHMVQDMAVAEVIGFGRPEIPVNRQLQDIG